MISKLRKTLELTYWRCSDAGLVNLPPGKAITNTTNKELYNIIRPHIDTHGPEILNYQKQWNQKLNALIKKFEDDYLSCDSFYEINFPQ